MPVIKLAATSVADFILGGSAVVGDAVAAGTSVDPFALEGFTVNDARIYTRDIDEPFVDFWARLYSVGSGDNLNTLNFYDTAFSTSQPVLRVRGSTGNGSWLGTIIFEAWNGSTWTALATTTGTIVASRTKIDIQYVRDNSAGIVNIYLDNSLSVSVTAADTDLAAWTNINRITFEAGTSAGGDAWIVSGFIISENDTRNYVFVQESFTGNGTETDWTGDYTGIDEVGLNNADEINSTTTNDQETFTGSLNNVIDAGYDIVASVVSFNVDSVGGPTELAAVYRIGGTTYETSSETAVTGTDIVTIITEISPATASAFTASEIEGAEIGVANKTT